MRVDSTDPVKRTIPRNRTIANTTGGQRLHHAAVAPEITRAWTEHGLPALLFITLHIVRTRLRKRIAGGSQKLLKCVTRTWYLM